MSLSSPASVPADPSLWDRIGIGLSGLCAVHCLLVPVLLAVLPLWPSASLVHAWLHPVFALLLVPVTVLAIVNARRRRAPGRVTSLLAVGLALVLAAQVLHVAGETVEVGLTLVGSVLLVVGHVLNARAAHSCEVH